MITYAHVAQDSIQITIVHASGVWLLVTVQTQAIHYSTVTPECYITAHMTFSPLGLY